MPTNPFSGIISQDLKDLHANMIKALLEDSALTVNCRLYFGITKYTSCDNCTSVPSPIGRKAANTYLHGGPVPFNFGQTCPICGGEGKIPYEATEDLKLAVIFNPKKYVPVEFTVNIGDGTLAQTFCESRHMPKLLQANYIIFDTDIQGYETYKYQRGGKPQPMGFGSNVFILTTWQRI